MPAESHGLHRAETFSALDQRRRFARRRCSLRVLLGTPGAEVATSGSALARLKAFYDALAPAPGDIP
jgi:hypothetical protein